MKLSASAITLFGYALMKVSAHPSADEQVSLPTNATSPHNLHAAGGAPAIQTRTENKKDTPPGMTPEHVLEGNNGEATAATKVTSDNISSFQQQTTKGLVLSKGGFGAINTSSIASAQAAGIAILQALPEYSGSETFVPINSNAKHMRYGQQVHGMDVEGASLYVHVDKFGTVIGVNGEIVDGTSVPAEPTIDASTAIDAALKESRVPAEAYGNCSPPTLTVVRGLKDGEAHLAWTCTVRYDVVGEDGYLTPFNDQIFAKATGDTPGLIQIYPKIYGERSLETRNCQGTKDTCPIVSTSRDKITLPSDLPVQAAHNFAIDTHDYYMQKHGRDSIDGKGMKLISRVHYDKNYNNAFWDGSQMTYGDGDGINWGPFSLAGDIVAHELTHGVTAKSSGLIYENESGALNEAMSDIFGALVDSFRGKSENDIWLNGEDAYTPSTPGDASRYMCDPAKDNASRDYYPDRIPSTETPNKENDFGGVHSNSGIANLAACLLVKGGTHPRGKTAIDVPAIVGGYDALGSIFYQANTNCLTRSANFAAARFCTAEVFGGSNKANVNLAWDAVGVPTDLLLTFRPTMMPTEMPTTMTPTTMMPTNEPTMMPTTLMPTNEPTMMPTTLMPTNEPTIMPTTMMPTSKAGKNQKAKKQAGSKSDKGADQELV